MEEKKYIVVSCESGEADVQLETLKPGQGINLFGIYLPVGIESKLTMKCVVEEVQEKEGKKVVEELGEIFLNFETDEGKVKYSVKMSSGLPRKIEERLGLKLI